MKTKNLIYFLLLPLCISLVSCKTSEEKADNHYQKALVYLKQDKDKSALIELRNAIELNPKFADARYQLALLYLDQQELKKAFNEFQRAASLDPQNLDAANKVAEFLLISKN